MLVITVVKWGTLFPTYLNCRGIVQLLLFLNKLFDGVTASLKTLLKSLLVTREVFKKFLLYKTHAKHL